MSILNLKEIVWEITNKCGNNCSYCGSKYSVVDEELTKSDSATIATIIDRIAEYPPAVLDISGGDPLLVDAEAHCDLKEKLPNTRRQIIVNPKSFDKYTVHRLNLVNLYNQVGISLNTEDEIRSFNSVRNEIKIPITIITNFSLLNLYLVDAIASVVSSLNAYWQVQFTMLTDTSVTVYDKPQAVGLLNTMLGKHTKIIVADNANEASCLAGINSMGILHNGLVVPCLSMRSWCSTLTHEIQGNLMEESLKDIWTTRFQKNRFEADKCCKDFCKNEKIKPAPKLEPTTGYTITTTPITKHFDLGEEIMRRMRGIEPIKSPNVTVYACFSDVTPVYSAYFNDEISDDNTNS